MKKSTLWNTFLASALAATMIACGSDGGSPTSSNDDNTQPNTTPTTTEMKYVERAILHTQGSCQMRGVQICDDVLGYASLYSENGTYEPAGQKFQIRYQDGSASRETLGFHKCTNVNDNGYTVTFESCTQM